MSGKAVWETRQGGRARAVELLELHDDVDQLDEELRIQKIAVRLTTLVSMVLAAPLLIVLFLNHVRFFLAYPSTFVLVLGAIRYALRVQRRRLIEERDTIRTQIRQMEDERPPRDH